MSARKDFSTFASLWLLSNRADIFAFCDQAMPQTMPQTVLQTVLRLCSQLMPSAYARSLWLLCYFSAFDKRHIIGCGRNLLRMRYDYHAFSLFVSKRA